MNIRKLTADEVEFSFDIESDDIPVRGSFASGDNKLDKELEDDIIKRVNGGDILSWCCAKVTAEWEGHKGHAYLGGCSYDSYADAEKDLFENMKDEALDALNGNIEFKCKQARTLLDCFVQ